MCSVQQYYYLILMQQGQINQIRDMISIQISNINQIQQNISRMIDRLRVDVDKLENQMKIFTPTNHNPSQLRQLLSQPLQQPPVDEDVSNEEILGI